MTNALAKQRQIAGVQPAAMRERKPHNNVRRTPPRWLPTNRTHFPFDLHVTDRGRRFVRTKVRVLLTVRSGLSLSRWLTARMTPDLHGHRPMSPISGGSSPATQRKRFPTSSGRASTAMALRRSKPPLEKTSQQRRPYRPATYDMKNVLENPTV